MTDSVYELHGLRVKSLHNLSHEESTASDFDVRVLNCGTEPVPVGAPEGRSLAALVDDGHRTYYSFVEVEAGYVLRFHGIVEFRIDRAAETVRYVVDPAVDAGLADVLVRGALLAFLLLMRGHLVLHASAVEHDGSAIAIVGGSGMGKSTLASILCAAGCRMIADDVLRVDVGDTVTCWRGATEARLRQNSAPLADSLDVVKRRTADERVALSLEPAPLPEYPVSCVVVPRPSRDSADVRLTLMPPKDALILLSGFPRFPGWSDARVIGQQFLGLSDLVARVPIAIADVPWGPPFAPSIAQDLLKQLRAACTPP